MKSKKLAFLVVLFLGLCYVPTACLAGGLNWRGQDLQALGLYKGSGLPLGPAIFNTYSYPNGGKQLPAGIPANTVLSIMLINYYTANELKDDAGNTVSGTHDIDALTFFPRAVWFLPWQPSNPHLRLTTDLILPISTINASTEPNKLGVGGGGLGDIIWGPLELIVGSVDLFCNQTVLWSSYLTPLISFPSGRYNSNDLFNVGSNVYSFNFTWENWFNFPKLGPYGGPQFHNILLYTHHTKNDDFATPTGLLSQLGPTTSYTNGDFITDNLNFNYPVLEHLDIGLNVNFIQQITQDKMAGSDISHSYESAISLGPNLYYMKGAVSLAYRASFEVYAKNRFQGMNNWLVLTYTF